MKTPWRLVILPLLGGLMVCGVCLATGPDVPALVLRADDTVVFALAGVASLAACLAFQPGDYLRRAWALMAASNAFLVIDTLCFGVASPFHARDIGTTGALISGVITIAANLTNIVALVIVARAWRVAGLSFEVKQSTYVVIQSLVTLGALVLFGPTVVKGVLGAADQLDGLHVVASTVGDMVSVVVMVPLVLTAFSFRGGSLAWPWFLLALSTLCWLGVDGSDALGLQWHLAPATVLLAGETLRAVASLLQVSAAWAQRAAIRS